VAQIIPVSAPPDRKIYNAQPTFNGDPKTQNGAPKHTTTVKKHLTVTPKHLTEHRKA